MSWLYDWAADILCFLVLMSLLEMLLPSKKYVRYIRFFAGIVLILVTARPLLSGLGIAQEMDRYFEEFSFQAEARDIRRDVLGIEEERRRQLFLGGEEAAAEEVEAMAREAGFVPLWAEVEIEKDAESEEYGTVVRVSAAVRREDGEETRQAESAVLQETGTAVRQTAGSEAHADAAGEKSKNQETPEAATPGKEMVRPVRIEIGTVEIASPEQSAAGEQEAERPADIEPGEGRLADVGLAAEREAASGPEPEAASAEEDFAELKRKVERYYELEPENVEIQLERR